VLLADAILSVLSIIPAFRLQGLLTDAPRYFSGATEPVMIDNTHVVVLHGSGREMVPVPEMAALCKLAYITMCVGCRLARGIHNFIQERIRQPVRYIARRREVTCTVKAIEVRHSEVTASNYMDYNIESVSKPLPEGRYQLLVNNDVTANMEWWNGRWWRLARVNGGAVEAQPGQGDSTQREQGLVHSDLAKGR
jgi:hypothetical protein